MGSHNTNRYGYSFLSRTYSSVRSLLHQIMYPIWGLLTTFSTQSIQASSKSCSSIFVSFWWMSERALQTFNSPPLPLLRVRPQKVLRRNAHWIEVLSEGIEPTV